MCTGLCVDSLSKNLGFIINSSNLLIPKDRIRWAQRYKIVQQWLSLLIPFSAMMSALLQRLFKIINNDYL